MLKVNTSANIEDHTQKSESDGTGDSLTESQRLRSVEMSLGSLPPNQTLVSPDESDTIELIDSRDGPNGKVKAAARCLRCSKELSNKQTLRRHCHDVHGVNPDLTPVEVRTFPCPEPLCTSKTFKRRTQLYAHMRAVHNGKSRGRGRRLPRATDTPQTPLLEEQLGSFADDRCNIREDQLKDIFSDCLMLLPQTNDGNDSESLRNPSQTQENGPECSWGPGAIYPWQTHPSETKLIDSTEIALRCDNTSLKQISINQDDDEHAPFYPSPRYTRNVGKISPSHIKEHPILPLETFSDFDDVDLRDIEDGFQALNETGDVDVAGDMEDQTKRKMYLAIEEKYRELSDLDEEIQKIEELQSKRSKVSKDITSLEGKLQRILPCTWSGLVES
ncbi:MAG: hypothetical protein Q9187_005570 [Circinaria calcarea]